MNKTVRNRLKRLEDASEENNTEIIRLIKSGAFYDELTDEQKEAYCRYWNFTRQSYEEVTLLLVHTLHEPLEKKFVPKSSEEERQHIKEVSEEIEKLIAEKYSQNE